MADDGDRARRQLITLAVLCVVGVAVLYLVAVHTSLGQRIDEKAVAGYPWQRTASGDAHRYQNGVVLLIAVLGLSTVAVAWRRWKLILALGAAALAAVLLAGVLRTEVLGRPNLVGHNWLVGASFPSGHTTAATTVALVCLVLAPWHRWIRRLAGLVVMVVTDGVLLFIPIHRPSDVVAGHLLGLAAIAAALALVGTRADRVPVRSEHPAAESFWRRLLMMELAAAALTALELVAMIPLARRGGFTLADYGAGFPISLAGVIAVGAAAMTLFESFLPTEPPGVPARTARRAEMRTTTK